MNEYNEYNETKIVNKNKNGLIKTLLFTLLAIVLFLLLLTWFFPTKTSLSPLMQDVFRNNITSMQDAGKSYFTNERLPQKEGESVKLTLKEMLDMKLILPFVDKNGKQCSMTDSYVTLTKEKTEYILKVNLSCSDQESYILEHIGCHDICAALGNCGKTSTCTGADCDTPITQYEFKRETAGKKIVNYTCPSNYILDSATNTCVKKDYKTTTETANPIYANVDKITSRPYETKEVTNYLYKYMKDVTTTTYVPDVNQPIRHYTYDNIIGYYTKNVCVGYKYFVDQTTSTLYQYGGFAYSHTETMTIVPQDTATTRYKIVGMDYDICSNTCTINQYFKVEVYTASGATVISDTTYANLSAECIVEEQQVPIYGLKITFSGFVTDKVVTTETKTEWSESKTDQSLIDQNYGYVGIRKANGKTETKVYGNCPEGTTISTTDDTKCVKTEKVLTGYSCPTQGFKYNSSSKKCEKTEVIGTDVINATPVYETVNGVEYKWSKCKTLNGWVATGRTREV